MSHNYGDYFETKPHVRLPRGVLDSTPEKSMGSSWLQMYHDAGMTIMRYDL